MYISRLRVKNYKVFIDSGDITLLDNITAITGKNNVGKSFLLEVLDLFGKKIANPGKCLPRLKSPVSEDIYLEIVLSMQSDDLSHHMETNRKEFLQQLESIIKKDPSLAPLERETLEDVYALVTCDQFPDIMAEFTLPKKLPKGVIRQLNPVFGSWVATKVSVKDTGLTVKSSMDINNNIGLKEHSPLTLKFLELGPILSIFNGILTAFRELSKRTFHFSPHRVLSPKLEVEVKYDENLLPDGSNLREVVSTLHNNRDRHPDDDFPRLEKFISSIFPEIRRIKTPITPQAKFTESSSGATGTDIKFVMRDNPLERSDLYISISESGTGVEQLLTLATKVITSKEPHLFLIDEPHAFLHPDAERKLIAFLREHKQHQYVIATNSPVILNSVSPDAVQLLVREEQNTKARGVYKEKIEDVKLLFQELGLRPTDIWHSDKIIWVEGPTEENLLPLISKAVNLDLELSGVKIIGLERVSLFTSAKPKIKRVSYELVKFMVETLTPLPPDYKFLFDLDEKNADEQKRIKDIDPSRITFLDRREIENYLFDPDAVYELISREREEPISKESFMEKFSSLMDDIENRKLYPEKPGKADVAQIKGSALLDEIYQEYLKREYNKIKDGVKLASMVGEKSPTNFDFFKKAFSDFLPSS